MKKEKNNEPFIGQMFGKWQFVEKTTRRNSSRNLYWKCICTGCNTEYEVLGTELRRGKSTQCRSCAKRKKPIFEATKNNNVSRQNVIDETNNHYGLLEVIEQVESNSRGAAQWRCKCECGNEIITLGILLRSGKTTSCGCKGSRGESKIATILSNNNIIYQTQYSFKDLLSKKGHLLKFDFAIFDNNNQLTHLIEYQGEFHYIDPPLGWNDIRENDIIKKEYCIKHNIKLVEIPYWEYDNITLAQLL